MKDALLKLLRGRDPAPPAWIADITYWIAGRKQDGTAKPAWDSEPGYLQLHRDLHVMPYYDYTHAWVGAPAYPADVHMSSESEGTLTRNRISTPVGDLVAESRYLPESSCHACTRHYVQSESDLDVLLYVVENAGARPVNLDGYPARCERWAEYGGLPSVILPRTPLASLCYEWAGIENTVFLLADCEDKVRRVLEAMDIQASAVLDAVCAAAPPLVHFADNLSSDNLTGLYDPFMADHHHRDVQRLHEVGSACAVHLDGAVRGLLPKLIAAGFDTIEALTPQPVGDMSAPEMAQTAAGSEVILWGGVPGALFAPPYAWDDVQRHVLGVLEAWRDRPFVLGVADQVPPDGDITYCPRIAQLIVDACSGW